MFSIKGTLKEHMMFHSDNKPFSCDRCERTFYTKQSVRRHIDMVHKKLKPITCTICGRSFADKWRCEGHVKRVHQNPRSSKKANKLMTLQILSLGQNNGKAKETKDNSPQQDGGLEIKPDSGNSVTGDHNELDKESPSQEADSQEPNSETPDAWTCPECNQSFTSPAELEAHWSTTHSQEPTVWKCPHCPREFQNKTQFRNHKFYHTSEQKVIGFFYYCYCLPIFFLWRLFL